MPTAAKEIEITSEVKIGGPHSFFLIGGPCVIESESHAFRMAEAIRAVCRDLGIPFVFKASFDKANRSSIRSYRGPGIDKGLAILKNINESLQIPVVSDVHEANQVEKAAAALDIIQIPAFLCRQTDLIVEAAKTQLPINIKKGQFLSPREIVNVCEKCLSQGNDRLVITERGTCFGYNNLVFDPRSIPIMKRQGFPVAIDASHSVQKPGGQGSFSGGDAGLIPYIARAGISVGADGLFLEIHDRPDRALSDGYNSFNLNNLRAFCSSLLRLKKAVDSF